jgi:hypothetical protein
MNLGVRLSHVIGAKRRFALLASLLYAVDEIHDRGEIARQFAETLADAFDEFAGASLASYLLAPGPPRLMSAAYRLGAYPQGIGSKSQDVVAASVARN